MAARAAVHTGAPGAASWEEAAAGIPLCPPVKQGRGGLAEKTPQTCRGEPGRPREAFPSPRRRSGRFLALSAQRRASSLLAFSPSFASLPGPGHAWVLPPPEAAASSIPPSLHPSPGNLPRGPGPALSPPFLGPMPGEGGTAGGGGGRRVLPSAAEPGTAVRSGEKRRSWVPLRRAAPGGRPGRGKAHGGPGPGPSPGPCSLVPVPVPGPGPGPWSPIPAPVPGPPSPPLGDGGAGMVRRRGRLFFLSVPPPPPPMGFSSVNPVAEGKRWELSGAGTLYLPDVADVI